MRDVMIDLETMGRKAGCPIISIGAVVFDRNTGKLGEDIEIVFDFNDAMAHGEIDPDTVKWWMQQSQSARENLLRGSMGYADGLIVFTKWFAEFACDYCAWGNGATFDISILEDAISLVQDEMPWGFWAVRDCRTVEDLSPVTRKAFKREGTHHSALDDAKYQAKYISGMIQAIKGRDSA